MVCNGLHRSQSPHAQSQSRDFRAQRSNATTTTAPVSAAQRLRRWPARLDFLQSATGLALGLFMWVHMFFVATILLGKDAMWTVARMFEGYFIFGRPVYGLVSALVGDSRRRCSSSTPRWRCASSPRITANTVRIATT